jgi:hypothetical protein
VIKLNQSMVLTSRTSMNIDILGHSQNGHPRTWHCQADMDIQWTLRHGQPRNEKRGQKGFEHVAVSDPDPTADPDSTAHESPTCGFEWTEESSRTLILLWTCTCSPGHQGPHLAGTGEGIAALHPQ